MPFSIIDLFAGPGGLAEGFSSLADEYNNRVFQIKLSIEKDIHAHQTLTLRSFVRQFPLNQLPEEYYQFLREEVTLKQLYSAYPFEYESAINEAWLATLGVTPEDELDLRIANSLNGDTDWVLIGGPPCQAYSIVGRSRVGGIDKEDQRVHLYKEYLRIIARHSPAVFVMENVKGLLSAELDGEKIFRKILRDLSEPATVFPDFNPPSYRIYSLVKSEVSRDSDYLIKSEEFGIPQRRHRVILLGIRDDIQANPGTLEPSPANSLRSVIGLLPAIRSGISKEFISSEIVTSTEGLRKKRTYIPIDDSFEAWSTRIRVYFNELTNTFASLNHKIDFDPVLPETVGKDYFHAPDTLEPNHPLYQWYSDQRLSAALHHESRSHLTQDLKRYLFASLYTRNFGKFPRMEDYRRFGNDLVPDHENAESGKFNDRFRVQIPDEPATTVTSHISKDGHYFIHYDPAQCRSLTVREAARIQTFPDNYFFCGSRTQQFHQVGNAVPPFLAYQIAKIVRNILEPEGALPG